MSQSFFYRLKRYSEVPSIFEDDRCEGASYAGYTWEATLGITTLGIKGGWFAHRHFSVSNTKSLAVKRAHGGNVFAILDQPGLKISWQEETNEGKFGIITETPFGGALVVCVSSK